VRLELVTVGTELLLGHTVDTNAAWIGQALAERGLFLARRTTVGDAAATIQDAVRDALDRVGTVITTGGLGPTRDDITKHAIAALFGRRMTFSDAVWKELVSRYARLGRPLSPANRPQAEVPDGATVLANPRGTAPGLWLEGELGRVVMLPGVPREMRGLMRDEVIPRLAGPDGSGPVILSRTLRTAGIPESNLAAQLGAIEDRLSPLTLAYLPDATGVDLRVTAWGLPVAEANRLLDSAIGLLHELAGGHDYGQDGADLAGEVLTRLRFRRWRLAVTESCTGGLLGGRITAVPGSSDVFAGGLVTYDDAAKIAVAGVDPGLLGMEGAVSEPVAAALAASAARNFQAQVAVGITGIAGPSGGSDAKPVGTVCFGFQIGEFHWTERVVFPGSRTEIRARSAQHALYSLWRRLSD